MFSISTFTLFTVLASAFVAHAQVDPSEPGPGSVYPEGGSCPIVWGGDPSGAATWKSMNIQLMTGDNFNMIPITTVATGQDGSVNGRFSYTCPQVTLHSAVYFYQFTNNVTTDKTWTTRFAISTPAGATTPPPNATQPGTGDSIPWGVGGLANPSQAVPPPSGPGNAGAVPNLSSSASIPVVSSSSSLVPSAPPAVSPAVVQPSPSSLSKVVATPVVAAPSTTPSSTGTGSSGAVTLSATSIMTSLIIPAFALMFV